MFVYLGLIVVIFLYDCLLKIWGKLNNSRRNIVFLQGTFFLLWLLCALKKETVGTDISGYKDVYYLSRAWTWFDFSQVYFEKGYYILMQIFAKSGIGFQAFNAVCYAIIYYPWYVFCRKYSKQPLLSILIYICYQFFVFNMSGLRQAIALSICLIAYICFIDCKKYRVLKFCLLVIIATSFHRSAVVFFGVLGLQFVRPGTITDILFLICCLIVILLRPRIVAFLNNLGSYQTQVSISLGGSFLMLFCFTVFSLYIDFEVRKKAKKRNLAVPLNFPVVYMMMYAVVLNLALNGSIILRAANYASCFFTVAVPASLAYCDKKSQRIISFVFSLFLIFLFINEVLLPNQFYIIPYRFFWN